MPGVCGSRCGELVGASEEQAQESLLSHFEGLCDYFPAAAEVKAAQRFLLRNWLGVL